MLVQLNASSPSIDALLKRMADTMASVLEHEDCPEPVRFQIEQFAERIEASAQTTDSLVRGSAAKLRNVLPIYLEGAGRAFKEEIERDEARLLPTAAA
jgi:hypothetical protein